MCVGSTYASYDSTKPSKLSSVFGICVQTRITARDPQEGSFVTNSVRDQLDRNLSEISSEIRSACERSGRSQHEVRIVAVTKYAEWPWVEELSQLHTVFGENRPQQLAERQLLLPDIQWHLIGQLQKNKVRIAVRHASCIHSVDSVRLLERIAEVASAEQSPRILLQINITGEESKSGFAPEELREQWERICSFNKVISICGLMTMAEESSNPEDARPAFRQLRLLRDELSEHPASTHNQLNLTELSMGMSGDFIPAVEEGATLVRIGSRIFAGLTADHSPQDSMAGNG
ncbi:MAG: YggS family pyridoxal phosphate-dependent enzyme [Planctomyces sp.]|nr:YggS family pyridoxal phosphate-dependent enzyme [Planctomyces sp.]